MKISPQKKSNLPPHSWESHPRTHRGETSKPFLIAMVTIAAVIILILLLFVGKPLVGKAIEYAAAPAANQAGIFILQGQEEVGRPFIVPITANINTPSVGVSFVLGHSTMLTADCNLIFEPLDRQLRGTNNLAVRRVARCENGIIEFEYAALCAPPTAGSNCPNALNGQVTIANIKFTATGPTRYDLDFTDFNIIALDSNNDIIGEGNDATITVAAAAACTPASETCDQLDNDCDGQVDENNVCTVMSITSDAFNSGEAIPPEYTCDAVSGTEVSPPLSIRNIPSGTQSLFLIMDDPTFNPSQPAVHWVIYNIPRPSQSNILTIPQRGSVAGATVGRNQITQQNIYSGPCPPEGESHQYRFRVYALDTTITVPTLSSIQDSSNIIRGNLFENYFEIPGDTRNILQQATLTGLYYPPLVSESPRSGGGGFSCTSQWNCPSTWSYCNATLQQSRTCTDTNRCDTRKLAKLENRSCAACEESWICAPWNTCQNGQQTRSCVDEHSCRTALQKPVLQKSCAVAETGPAPARVQPQLPPPQVQQPAPVPVPSFWEQYKWFILGVPAALAVIILLIFGAVHLFKPKPAAYNAEELQDWIKKEQQMGTSNEDIKNILAQHTGWGKEEIEKSFGGLKEAGKVVLDRK